MKILCEAVLVKFKLFEFIIRLSLGSSVSLEREFRKLGVAGANPVRGFQKIYK